MNASDMAHWAAHGFGRLVWRPLMRALGFAYERDVEHLGARHLLYRRRA